MMRRLCALLPLVLLVSCGQIGIERGHNRPELRGLKPGAPTNPSPTNGAMGVLTTATLTWTAADKALRYDVFFGTAANPPRVSVLQTATSYTPPQMLSNVTYYWRVTAINGYGRTSSGTPWTFTTSTASAPAVPNTPNPPNDPAHATPINNNPTLTWVSAGATSYNVGLSTGVCVPHCPAAPGGTGLAVASLAITTVGSTTYTWEVRAFNAGGDVYGPQWTFTTNPLPLPGTPTNLSPATGATGIGVNPVLSWTATNAANYDVYFGAGTLPTCTPPLVSGAQANAFYSPATLAASTSYCWQIVARNGTGTTSGAKIAFTTAAPGAITVLNPATDLTYRGAFKLPVSIASGATFTQIPQLASAGGLTLKQIGGVDKLLALYWNGTAVVDELAAFDIPATFVICTPPGGSNPCTSASYTATTLNKTYGSPHPTLNFSDPGDPTGTSSAIFHSGIYWDAGSSQFFETGYSSYSNNATMQTLISSTLNDVANTVTNTGYWQFNTGGSYKSTQGGVTGIPASLRTAQFFGTGNQLAVGWGGCGFSILSLGGESCGPALRVFSATLPGTGTSITATKVVGYDPPGNYNMDLCSGCAADTRPAQGNQRTQRALRPGPSFLTPQDNQLAFDNNYPNAKSNAADTGSTDYVGTADWIDTGIILNVNNKRGALFLATLATMGTAYEVPGVDNPTAGDGTDFTDARVVGLVYDVNDLAAVYAGTKRSDQIQPINYWLPHGTAVMPDLSTPELNHWPIASISGNGTTTTVTTCQTHDFVSGSNNGSTYLYIDGSTRWQGATPFQSTVTTTTASWSSTVTTTETYNCNAPTATATQMWHGMPFERPFGMALSTSGTRLYIGVMTNMNGPVIYVYDINP